MTEPKTPDRNHPTNWVELREYIEARMADMQRHYDFRLDNMETVRQRTAEDLERKFITLDEAQRTKYPTREDIRHITETISADIRVLREVQAAQQGKASMAAFYFTLVIAVAGLGIAIFESLQHI